MTGVANASIGRMNDIGNQWNDQECPPEAFDMVARMTHTRVVDFKSATFRRHLFPGGSQKPVYTIKPQDNINDKVIQLGKEETGEEPGCDYVIAIVNKKTGVAEFIPAKLVIFEATYSNDLDILLGNKPPKQMDYSVDNSSSKETWADKRRALTSEFGSAKKVKIQEAAKRRQIKDETLAIMMNSSLASPVTSKEEGETSISLLKRAESATLPPFNEKAKTAGEVYSFDTFLTEAEVQEVQDEAYEFLQYPAKELAALGFPEIVSRMVRSVGADKRRASFAVFLAVMVHCYTIVGKMRRRFISEEEWSSLPYPSFYAGKMRELFFQNDFSKSYKHGAAKINVNSAEKDKLLAYIFCLAILLDSEGFSLPITPWAKALTVSEMRVSKITVALGCTTVAATPAEGVRLGTMRIARLFGPPATNPPSRKFQRPKNN